MINLLQAESVEGAQVYKYSKKFKQKIPSFPFDDSK